MPHDDDSQAIAATPMQYEVQALRREVRQLSDEVKGLVDAWNTAQGVVKFMKLLGGLATAATALYALLRLAWDMRGVK